MTADSWMDPIDRRIVRALQAEGRLTNLALADTVGLSASACLARVKRLEERGVIQGYHARLDPFALDIGLILFVEVTLARHGRAALFEAAIEGMPEVVEASHVSGEVDYLLKVVVPGMAAWTTIRDEFLCGDLDVTKVTTHVLISKPKIFTGYPVT